VKLRGIELPARRETIRSPVISGLLQNTPKPPLLLFDKATPSTHFIWQVLPNRNSSFGQHLQNHLAGCRAIWQVAKALFCARLYHKSLRELHLRIVSIRVQRASRDVSNLPYVVWVVSNYSGTQQHLAVHSERNSRADSRESGLVEIATFAPGADFTDSESYREQQVGIGRSGICGEKAEIWLAARGDVSAAGVNSRGSGFAPKSRLPGRNTKNRPVCEQCTAVT
jgi:hypothetical protein